MCDTLIVIKPKRIRQIPLKNWIFELCVLLIALFLLFLSSSQRQLQPQNTRQITGEISEITVTRPWYYRRNRSKVSIVVAGETCQIPPDAEKVRQLLQDEDIIQFDASVRILVAGSSNQVVEFEYGGTLFYTLAEANTGIQLMQRLCLIPGILALLLCLFLIYGNLLSYRIVIFRKRPKSINKCILIEK